MARRSPGSQVEVEPVALPASPTPRPPNVPTRGLLLLPPDWLPKALIVGDSLIVGVAVLLPYWYRHLRSHPHAHPRRAAVHALPGRHPRSYRHKRRGPGDQSPVPVLARSFNGGPPAPSLHRDRPHGHPDTRRHLVGQPGDRLLEADDHLRHPGRRISDDRGALPSEAVRDQASPAEHRGGAGVDGRHRA